MAFLLVAGLVGAALVGLSVGEATVTLAQNVAPSGLESTVRTWWPVLLTAGAGLVGYIRLQERHKLMESRARDDRKQATEREADMNKKLDILLQRVSHIEGMLANLGGKRT